MQPFLGETVRDNLRCSSNIGRCQGVLGKEVELSLLPRVGETLLIRFLSSNILTDIAQLKSEIRVRIYPVSQKCDVQIQIVIAATQLVRTDYTYSHFNYDLIGVINVANFDKIRSTVSEI